MAFPEDLTTALNEATLFLAGGHGTPRRVPVRLTSSWRRSRGVAPIRLEVNPQTVSFNQPKRIVKRDTQRGSTFFHFSDEFGRNNDILVIQFQGVTGNIDTRAKTVIRGNLVGGTKKLKAWANLYQLTREPMIDPQFGREIEYYINYQSPLFINMFTFVGHFNEVLTFSESADQPWLKDWSFSFTVTQTEPSLDDIFMQITTTLQGLDTLGRVGALSRQNIDALLAT